MTQSAIFATIIALCSLVGCASQDRIWSSAPQTSVPQTIEEYPALANIKKIYIASLGNEEGAGVVRENIRLRLAKSTRISVVETPDKADAVLTGVAGVERRYSGSGGNLRTRYAGIGVLRLIDVKTSETVWTFEYRSGWGGSSVLNQFASVSSVSSGVADQTVDKLLKDATYADSKN